MTWIQRTINSTHARELREYLDADYPDTPFRVYDGMCQEIMPTNREAEWTDAQIPEDFSLTECNENGVTIHFWGTLSPNPRTDSPIISDAMNLWTPASEYVTGSVTIYDLLTVSDPSPDYMQFELEGEPGTIISEAGPHEVAVFLSHGLTQGYRWEQILGEAIEFATSADAGATAEAALNRHRERFVEILGQRNDSELRQIRTRVEGNRANLTSYLRSITETRHQLQEDQRLIDAAMAASPEMDEETRNAEFDAVLRHAHVERVRIVGSTIHVFTDELTMEVPGYDPVIVGAFDIELNLDYNSANARNLTNRRGTYDHPHIHDGSFCLGDMTDTVQRLLASRNLGPAINLVIESLQTVTPEDDWGRSVYLWLDQEAQATVDAANVVE